MSLRTEELDYDLPRELVAQEPLPQRDESRLLVLHRKDGQIEHRRFTDIDAYLRRSDCLVVNTTRVRRARLLGRRATGGQVEALIVRRLDDGTWETLLKPAGRLRQDERIEFEGDVAASLVGRGPDGLGYLRFESVLAEEEIFERFGHVPLPPYINRTDRSEDAERYQTVYAQEMGAVAAPTAGLHFTPELLQRLEAAGVRRADLLLHVGPGTFRPITADLVAEHRLEAEWTHIPADTTHVVRATRAEGGRCVAVGTTCVRALEAWSGRTAGEFCAWNDLLIAPPFEFKVVGAMITNFHLPRSSLLALVIAFAGREQTFAAYRAAVRERYRFYSYGDAMLIL